MSTKSAAGPLPLGVEVGSEFGLSRRGGYLMRLRQCSTSEFTRTIFTANGRAAIELAARYAVQKSSAERRTVLVPSYVCPSVIQPFQAQGLAINFYPIKSDLSINPTAICERVSRDTLAVVLLHYFGFPQPVDLVHQLAANFPDVMLIDDRTHLLLTDMHAGRWGSDDTFTVYSPRKWGPFPDLGMLIPPRHSILAPDKGYDWEFGFWRVIDIVLRAVFFAWPTRTLRRLSLYAYRRAEGILDKRIDIRSSSLLSILLWRYWNWQETFNSRRNNYCYLLDQWPIKQAKPIFDKLPDYVCPLGFPILSSSRDALAQYLNTKSIFCPIHWPPSSLLPRDQFPEADFIIQRELTIPIDQRYHTKDMDRVLEAVYEYSCQ